MELTFRDMSPGEAPELRKLARKSFGPVEGLLAPRIRKALVAVLDGKIAGGFGYQFETAGGKKIGYASLLVTDPALQGRGIGKALCERGIQLLWEEGCDALVTFVRRDMAANAIAAWAFLLGLAAAGTFAGDAFRALPYAPEIAAVFLTFRCLPVNIFGSSGFGRVRKWNKAAALMLLTASVFAVLGLQFL